MSDGWRVRVTTVDGAGQPAIFRDYLVFEANKARAFALVRMHMSVNDGETIEVCAPALGPAHEARRCKGPKPSIPTGASSRTY